MIAGVCGGFAAYSGIDANIVRLMMVLLAVLGGGSGVVLYLVAMPDSSRSHPATSPNA